MLYDDGFDEFKIVKAEPQINSHRAYKLCDGDIFTIVGMTIDTVIEYEDNNFFEVVESGIDMFGQIEWKRTGKTFTIDELNELIK